MDAKESAVAKSRGPQDKHDMSPPDAALLQVLYNKKKISKDEANYVESDDDEARDQSCIKCKFNLGDEGKCHVVKEKSIMKKASRSFSHQKAMGCCRETLFGCM
jgi:hypothetical protein